MPGHEETELYLNDAGETSGVQKISFIFGEAKAVKTGSDLTPIVKLRLDAYTAESSGFKVCDAAYTETLLRLHV